MVCGAVVETPVVVVPAGVIVTVEGCVVVFVVVVVFISVGVKNAVAVLPVVLSVVVEVVITIGSAVDVVCGSAVETPAVVLSAGVNVSFEGCVVVVLDVSIVGVVDCGSMCCCRCFFCTSGGCFQADL